MMRVDGRDLKEWEGVFIQTISAPLKEERLDSLAYEVTESEIGLNQAWKTGADKVEVHDGVTTTTLNIKLVTIKPVPILIKAPIESWVNNPKNPIDWLFRDLAREVGKLEAQIFLASLFPGAEEFKTNEEKVSTVALNEAGASISKALHNADTVVIHPVHHTELFSSKDFFSVWGLPPEIRGTKGTHFYGFLGGIEVYWTPDIDRRRILYYEKMSVRVKRSPLTLAFDDYDDPKYLIAEEKFVAWTTQEGAIGIIDLGQTA